MNRILLGGVVGGMVIFGWGFVAHVVLPIGGMGTPVLETLSTPICHFTGQSSNW